MKRILLAILLAVNTTLTWAADGIVLGYCNGQVTRNGNISIDGQASVEAAIVLTADMLAPYDGAQLSTVRVGLAARTNIDNLRVWVRRTLTGDNLAQGYVDGEDLKRGPNPQSPIPNPQSPIPIFLFLFFKKLILYYYWTFKNKKLNHLI